MEKSNEREQRITQILGADSLDVTLKSLTLYRDYLRKNLDTPCLMTGVEGFPWETQGVEPEGTAGLLYCNRDCHAAEPDKE